MSSISKPNQKQVALVIGASRGIGRQIAIDLAREGYAGTYLITASNHQPFYFSVLISLHIQTLTKSSGRRRKIHFRRANDHSLSPRSKQPSIHNLNRSPRNPRSRRNSNRHRSRHPLPIQHPKSSRSDHFNLLSHRCFNLQLWSNILVLRPNHTHQTLRTNAARQRRRMLRCYSILSSSIQVPELCWPHYSC